MIIWDDKKKAIGIKLRISTLDAMELLDRNKFKSRTNFVERCVEDYLIRQGLLEDGRTK